MVQSDDKIPAKGGLSGFLKGTQPLSTAFWLIGVIPAVVIFLIMVFVLQSHTLDFRTFLLYSFLFVGVHRLFAWTSIIRCRKNSSSSLLSTLAIMVVVIDILYKLLFTGMYVNKYYEKENNKQELVAIFEQCKQEVSQRYQKPLEELETNHMESYSGGDIYYGVKHDTDYYECYLRPDSIEIRHRKISRGSSKSLANIIEEVRQEKFDSIHRVGETSQDLILHNQKLDAQKIREAILRSSSDSPLVTIAKSIMEVNNVNQVISLKKKMASYELNPNSVFRNGEYVYDSKNRQNEVVRGLVDDDIKYTKWLLLIDNLQNADYLWEFDNSDSHSSLVSAIEVLAKEKKYILSSIPKVDDDNLTIIETLGMFNTTLNEQGLTLIELYIDGDSHVTGLIKKENLEQLKKNAKFAGYMILEY